MADDKALKQQVSDFYNQVGWQKIQGDIYQNATYEDLRLVSQTYIERCHLRVNRHLQPQGKYLLDAGSGPVQYPAYLTYSAGYQHRVCLDISFVALKEARKRLKNHGLYVVADVAHLPFKKNSFDGVVSLHTLHHLTTNDQVASYFDIHRVLAPDRRAVIVNGWGITSLMNKTYWLVKLVERLNGKKTIVKGEPQKKDISPSRPQKRGTFVEKTSAEWLKKQLVGKIPFDIFVWRSVSVRFMRALIHPGLGGKFLLNQLYKLEEKYPTYFGENGQYPMIVLRKG
jgi:SAM-dependent methyltransferase